MPVAISSRLATSEEVPPILRPTLDLYFVPDDYVGVGMFTSAVTTLLLTLLPRGAGPVHTLIQVRVGGGADAALPAGGFAHDEIGVGDVELGYPKYTQATEDSDHRGQHEQHQRRPTRSMRSL